MRIYEAAESVLRDAGRPMAAKEIHAEIVRRGLFEFGAKDPVSVVTQTLRKKSLGERPTFRKVGPSTYDLLVS